MHCPIQVVQGCEVSSTDQKDPKRQEGSWLCAVTIRSAHYPKKKPTPALVDMSSCGLNSLGFKCFPPCSCAVIRQTLSLFDVYISSVCPLQQQLNLNWTISGWFDMIWIDDWMTNHRSWLFFSEYGEEPWALPCQKWQNHMGHLSQVWIA